MKLITEYVRVGEWIVIEHAAPHSTDLSPQYVKLNDKEYPAFVDGPDLRLRCPQMSARNTIEVAVNGILLGRVQLLA